VEYSRGAAANGIIKMTADWRGAIYFQEESHAELSPTLLGLHGLAAKAAANTVWNIRRWKIWNASDFELNADVAESLRQQFAETLTQPPLSAFNCFGSPLPFKSAKYL